MIKPMLLLPSEKAGRASRNFADYVGGHIIWYVEDYVCELDLETVTHRAVRDAPWAKCPVIVFGGDDWSVIDKPARAPAGQAFGT